MLVTVICMSHLGPAFGVLPAFRSSNISTMSLTSKSSYEKNFNYKYLKVRRTCKSYCINNSEVLKLNNLFIIL